MSETRPAASWQLGWWSPTPGAAVPADVLDPGVHGPLLAARADGSPLDRLGRHRLEGLLAEGLVAADGMPRVPLAIAEHAAQLRHTAADLGSKVARLVAGEWSRLEVAGDPLRSRFAGPGARFLLVGGLVLDVGVRRSLRRAGLAAPPFGSAYAWLAEGPPGAAGTWFARVSVLPGRGRLIRFGRPEAPGFERLAAEPEAAPALPAAAEPRLRQVIDLLASGVARAVEDGLPALEPVRRRLPGSVDDGAFLAFAYSLVVDAALGHLVERGLVEVPAEEAVALRVEDPVLGGA